MAITQPITRVFVSAGVLFLLVATVHDNIAAGQCEAPTVVARGPRYLEITPPPHPTPVAIFVSQDPEEPLCTKYVDFEPALAHLGVGRLLDEPVFLMPEEWGTLYVRGAVIVPSGTYGVRTDCGTAEVPDLSDATVVTTPIWGDVVGEFYEGAWMPSDGDANFDDITAAVDTFRHLPWAPPVDWPDLLPNVPDYTVDFNDIAGTVDAFRGIPYVDDCNGNGVLDACDVAAGTSEDCNSNGIPDECDTDCQPNGIPDDCDIAWGTSEDCQPNNVPDECDIASGTSEDCQPSDVPDECEPCDCYFPSSGITIPNYPREACHYQGGICLDCP
ncbi:MAG: hypothetical protein WBE26_14875 [Phycisphaerae bacterium]